MRCECCGGPRLARFARVTFACLCMDELFCRTCNKCEKHCKCAAGMQVLDVPLTEQLAVAKFEARLMGVGI